MISPTRETILIQGNQYTYSQQNLKQPLSNTITLERIKQILQKNIPYYSISPNDENAKLTQEEHRQKLGQIAKFIQQDYRKNPNLCNYLTNFWNFFVGEDDAIHLLCKQIENLLRSSLFLKLPAEIIQLILSFLSIRDILNMSEVDRRGRLQTQAALISRIQVYDHHVESCSEAVQIFKKLFKKIDHLIWCETIPKECIAFHKDAIDYEETLKNVRALTKKNKLHQHFVKVVRESNLEEAKLYLMFKVSMDLRTTQDKNTLLHIAFKNLELLTLFCEKGARPNAVNILRKTALHHIVEANEPVSTKKAIIALLLKYGAHLEAKDAQENTALSLAREPKIVKALCKNGALVDHQAKGLTSLHNAAYHAQFETVKILLEYGANCNLKDPEGRTALYFAASKNPQRLALKQDPENKNKIIKQLLQKGADPDRFENDHMPLKAYLANDQFLTPDPEVIELFCKKTKKINSHIDADGYYLLHHTILKNQIEAVKILLKHHADPNIKKDNTQTTPLHIAVTAKQSDSILCSPEIIEALCKAGANPNHQDEQGNSSLHLAVREGRFEHIEILLKYGADPTLKNALNETPVTLAKDAEERDEILRGCLQRK